MNHSFIVCIPAAGSGERMKTGEPKQYMHVVGKPVLAHTLSVFDGMDECQAIIIATDNPDRLARMLEAESVKTPTILVHGGATRQQSVANTLTECGDDGTIVLIHDAARPCVRQKEIRSVAAAVAEHGAAVLALRARDTVKEEAEGTVNRTLDRLKIWLAQTPQGARAGMFRNAFKRALRDGYTGTDDVSLLERDGVAVRLVEGSVTNLKLTTPDDIPLIEAVLRQQGRMEE